MKIALKHGTIRVDFFFFAVLCALSFFDRSGLLLPSLFSALLHEAGHLTAMYLLPGQAPTEMDVTPFGLRLHGAPLAEYMDGRLIVLAAGSAANWLAAGVLLPFFPRLAALNFVMGALNLLPVDSLDGGGLLRLVLRRRMGEAAAEAVLTAVSLLTLIVISLVGVTVLFRSRYNFTLLGLSLTLLFSLLLRLAHAHSA
ncbi:MAG: hypothetical protein IIY93_09415 [Clostridia bacterium]|nr:hypothetical protein [Clostridia bacterium]MBQ1555181.1 hypothetical protein [Clostridia bacterium]